MKPFFAFPLLVAATALAAVTPASAQQYGYGQHQPPPPPPQGPRGIPGQQLHMQMDALEARIRTAQSLRHIEPDQANRALQDLLRLRAEDADIRARNAGRVSDLDRGRIQQQIDELSRRVERDATRDAPPPPPPGPGGYGQGYGGQPDAGAFWRDAPVDIHAREDWMEMRIRRFLTEGRITRDQAGRAFANLRSIRDTEATMLRRHGRLTYDDRMMLQMRLDGLTQAIGWMRRSDRGY